MAWLRAQVQETRGKEQVKACEEVQRVAQAEHAGLTRGDCKGLEKHLSVSLSFFCIHWDSDSLSKARLCVEGSG